jgi:hypothetical protein
MSALEMIPDDKTLFHRIQSGDQEAFDQFYRRHFDDLYRAAFRRLPDKEACLWIAGTGAGRSAMTTR